MDDEQHAGLPILAVHYGTIVIIREGGRSPVIGLQWCPLCGDWLVCGGCRDSISNDCRRNGDPALVASAQAREKLHPCAADALKKAEALLRLQAEAGADQPFDVEKTVKVLAPVKTLKGKGRFDVLEVWRHVYKAAYRMRFICAQIPNTWALMGQEIPEADNPY